jgi:hypothetical protein
VACVFSDLILLSHPNPAGLFLPCQFLFYKLIYSISPYYCKTNYPNIMPINLNELQALLTKAEANTVNEKEIRKGLTRIENLLTTIGQEVEKVYTLLDGAAPAKKERRANNADAEAPFGRKADGTPKKRPGRIKADAAA